METTIVNIRHSQCDVYCGRPTAAINPEEVPIGEYGFLGNPFIIGKGRTRETSVALFAEYFHKRIQDDLIFRGAVTALDGSRLGCWCAPLECHANAIAAWLNKEQWLPRQPVLF